MTLLVVKMNIWLGRSAAGAGNQSCVLVNNVINGCAILGSSAVVEITGKLAPSEPFALLHEPTLHTP